MKKLLFAVFIAFFPSHALADACHDKISAMFEGGALDPFVRAPHRLTNTMTDANGGFIRRYLTRWQTPERSVSGVEGSGLFAMIIDHDSWTGPTPDGPWTKAPNSLPADHMDVRRAQHKQEQANLSEAECFGAVEMDGKAYEVVGYVTRTDPNPKMQGMWFGARHKVFIDPDSGRVMRWESTDFVSSFAPKKSSDKQVHLFNYDDALTIPRPE